MNKQKLIKRITYNKYPITTNSYEVGWNDASDKNIEFANKLDEPEKPVVPQFVADYIDSEQHSCSTLSEAIDNMDDERHILDWFYVNAETFAKAWLYGYEVEKEKLYTVKFSNEDFGKI